TEVHAHQLQSLRWPEGDWSCGRIRGDRQHLSRPGARLERQGDRLPANIDAHTQCGLRRYLAVEQQLPGPNFATVEIGVLPVHLKTPPPAFQAPSSAFQPSRSSPLNRSFSPLASFAISSGFGFVVGSSLIFKFRKRHSEPSDSNAR